MPNWIESTVKISERIEEFKKVVFNEEEIFDLDKIRPMPKSLGIPCGTNSYRVIEETCPYENKDCLDYFQYHVIKNLNKVLDECYTDEISIEDFIAKVCDLTERNPEFKWEGLSEEQAKANKEIPIKARGYWNYKKYGYVDWYNWCWENWGTKLNISSCSVTEIENSLYITIRTAWETPHAIWEYLSEQGFNFSVIYADEDFGSNLGIIKSKYKFLTYDHFDDLNDDERCYLSSVIYNEVDYLDENTEVSSERKEELVDMVSEYLA